MARQLKKYPSIRLGIPALVCGLLVSGCFETEVAGTSTTTGNTISARALLSDGSPAVGAKVSLRQSGFIPPGVPGNLPGAFSKDTTADAAGFFEIPVPAGMRYFLSVNAAGSQTEVFWRDGLTPTTALAKSAGPNDTVRLQKSGALSGHIVLGAGDSVWLGFPGTSHFTRPQGNGAFSLDSLPPGSHGLRVIRSISGAVQSLDVGGWTALPGATVVLDTLAWPGDTSIHILAVPACLDRVDSIVFASMAGGPSDAKRVFRSVLLSSPPEWVEVDACLGQWTRKAVLPNTVAGNLELFAGASGDYLILPDSNRILKLEATGSRTLPSFPDSLAMADFHAGRFYSFHHLDASLRSFPDEVAWLAKQYDRSFPRPTLIQRFAVNDSAIQFLIPDSAGIALARYNLNPGSFHAPVSLTGFPGNCVGMAAGAGEDIWLLSDGGELHRVDGFTGQVLLRAPVVTPYPLQGLAGGE